VTTGFQKIPEMAAGDVPGTLAELLKNCALRGLLAGLGVGELAGALLKEAKLLPAMFQVGQAISFRARTGQSLGYSSFTVSSPLKALKGAWVYQCGGSDRAIDFLFQGDDSWKVDELGPDNRVTAHYETFFATELDAGRPVMVIERTNLPGVKQGDRLAVTLQPGHDGFSDSIVIGNNPEWWYYRSSGRSYC
jgi:hypothetical protein